MIDMPRSSLANYKPAKRLLDTGFRFDPWRSGPE